MNIVEEIYTQNGRHIDFSGKVAYNLGSGAQIYKGVLNVDILPYDTVDIVHDLSKTPWPIESNSADVIMGFHFFEHIPNINAAMEEVYRILKPGGRLIIEAPYFRDVGAFQDPTHVRFFTSDTIGYFVESKKRQKGLYADVHFRLVNFWFGWPAPSSNPIIRLWKHFIRTHAKFYDNHLSKLFPVKIIVYEIEAVK